MERETIVIPSHDVNMQKKGDGTTVIDLPLEVVGQTMFGTMTVPVKRYRMGISYQDLDDVKLAVSLAKPPFRVVASALGEETVVVQEGDGNTETQLAFEKTTGPLPVYNCITLVHPWWEENATLPVLETPSPTQIDEHFVPGVTPSDKLGTAPVRPTPAPAPSPAPESPPVVVAEYDDSPPREIMGDTLQFKQYDGNHVDVVRNVRACDTIIVPISPIPANIQCDPEKVGTLSGTEFPSGSTQFRKVTILVDGQPRFDLDEGISISVSFTVGNPGGFRRAGAYFNVQPGQAISLRVQNLGPAYEPGGMRWTVTSPPKVAK